MSQWTLELGAIERFQEDGTYSQPDDEALIFVNDDSEQTIHIQCPDAKALAKALIAAFTNPAKAPVAGTEQT